MKIDLEDESSESEDTSQTGAREGSGLASTGGRNGDGLGGGDGSGAGDGGLAESGSGDGDGAVLGRGGAVLALDDGGGDDGLGDSAGAVSDGQGGGLECVSLGAEIDMFLEVKVRAISESRGPSEPALVRRAPRNCEILPSTSRIRRTVVMV